MPADSDIYNFPEKDLKVFIISTKTWHMDACIGTKMRQAQCGTKNIKVSISCSG